VDLTDAPHVAIALEIRFDIGAVTLASRFVRMTDLTRYS
jgi:hypothetical protein